MMMEFSKREEKVLEIMSSIDKEEFTLDDVLRQYYAWRPTEIKHARSSLRQCINLVVMKQAVNGQTRWEIQAMKGRGNKMKIIRVKAKEKIMEMA